MRPQSSIATALALLVLVLVSCHSGQASKPQQQSHLKPLAVLYGQYIGQHRGQPPANEAAFKQFVQSQEQMLAGFRVTDPESLFVSERDGKPFVILYGKTTGKPVLSGAPVIAYEQEGIDGRRFVADSLGAVEEVDETRFRELVPEE